MNSYCRYALHQIRVAIDSLVELVDCLEERDLQQRSTANKRSVGELLEHIATVCRADYYIANGANREEMAAFYSTVSLTSKAEIKEALMSNYVFLQGRFMEFNDVELHMEMTSYWGATYSRYEWLLEVMTHLYHHRGQLHTILVHCYGMDLKVQLFE
ncbi:DinB family protein [Sporosarcina sp. ANT_H38]|uniref:DinB family protein n=1 Tax=Sporosarcina sp. ANT_H38 TaxID=2597358 RepID=UPI0011F3299B|nr:DinB family protein [Sporosarcina sp. ANT_H38]KAA0965052.1 DinB family protein [Sporosarcina sp. ANT_H38]